MEVVGSDQLFKKKKFRKEQELARKAAKREPYETIRIVCEDTKSSPNYLKEIIKHFRLNTANVVVIPSKGSAPISVVNHAIELANTTDSIDRIYCVMDHDNHESLKRAINKIKNYNLSDKPIFQTIISAPCFEIWPLLHLRYTTKLYSSSGKKSAADNLHDDLLKLLPTYRKNTAHWFKDIIDKLETAIKNAKKLKKYNAETNSANPATDMHELIEYLMNLKSQITLTES